MDKNNPYSAPIDVPVSVDAAPPLEFKQTTFANALLRWTPICVVSAAPSFFYGCAVVNGKVPGIIAMLVGVAIAAVLYATLDIQPFWRRWMSTQIVRKAIISTFATRIVVSVIFPLAIVNDVLCGMISMGSVGFVFGKQLMAGEQIGPLQAFATTIVQGTLLSLELLILGLFFFGIIKAWDNYVTRRSRIRDSAVSTRESH